MEGTAQNNPIDRIARVIVGTLNGDIAQVNYAGMYIGGQNESEDVGENMEEETAAQKLDIRFLMEEELFSGFQFQFNENGKLNCVIRDYYSPERTKFHFRYGDNYRVIEVGTVDNSELFSYDSLVTIENYNESWNIHELGSRKTLRFFSWKNDEQKRPLQLKSFIEPSFRSFDKVTRKRASGKYWIRDILYERNTNGELLCKKIVDTKKNKEKIILWENFDYSEIDGLKTIVESDIIGDTIQCTSVSEEEGVTLEKIVRFKNKIKSFSTLPNNSGIYWPPYEAGSHVMETKKIKYSDANFKTIKSYQEDPNQYTLEVYDPKGRLAAKSKYNNSLLLFAESMRYDEDERHFKDEHHYLRYKLFDHEKDINDEYKVYYTYDEKDNWITRTIKKNGEAVSLQTREIIYR